MKIKEGVIKISKFIFPYGNWRWYLVYIPMLFTLVVSLFTYASVMNLIDQGVSIQTDTFYAYMPFNQSHLIKDWTVIVFLYNSAGYVWFVFIAHTSLSFVMDCGRLVWNKIVLPIYRWWIDESKKV